MNLTRRLHNLQLCMSEATKDEQRVRKTDLLLHLSLGPFTQVGLRQQAAAWGREQMHRIDGTAALCGRRHCWLSLQMDVSEHMALCVFRRLLCFVWVCVPSLSTLRENVALYPLPCIYRSLNPVLKTKCLGFPSTDLPVFLAHSRFFFMPLKKWSYWMKLTITRLLNRSGMTPLQWGDKVTTVKL